MGWGSHGCVVGRSCSWRYSLLCAKIFFLFYLRLTCIMFCQLLSESFEFFWVVSKFFLFPKFFFFNFGFLHVHMCSFFFLVLASEGLAQRGRHCHDSWQGHGHMSHICDILDPFWEVMWKLLIWLPNLYINNSHTKGFLCLARINSNFLWDTPSDWEHVFMCIVFIYYI